VRAEQVALVGFRALDPGERGPLGALGLALPAVAAHKLGMRTAAALALGAVENGDGPVLVHLDVDVIDPAEMPAKDALTPGAGLSLQETSELLTALVASPRVVALDVCEFNPDLDPRGLYARRIVEIVARALVRRFKS
jgi:arginase